MVENLAVIIPCCSFDFITSFMPQKTSYLPKSSSAFIPLSRVTVTVTVADIINVISSQHCNTVKLYFLRWLLFCDILHCCKVKLSPLPDFMCYINGRYHKRTKGNRHKLQTLTFQELNPENVLHFSFTTEPKHHFSLLFIPYVPAAGPQWWSRLCNICWESLNLCVIIMWWAGSDQQLGSVLSV